MADIVLGCSTVEVVSITKPVFQTLPPQRQNVLVLPVKQPPTGYDTPIVVGPEGSIDYSTLSDGTLVFEY